MESKFNEISLLFHLQVLIMITVCKSNDEISLNFNSMYLILQLTSYSFCKERGKERNIYVILIYGNTHQYGVTIILLCRVSKYLTDCYASYVALACKWGTELCPHSA
jgi:hypothetical protein